MNSEVEQSIIGKAAAALEQVLGQPVHVDHAVPKIADGLPLAADGRLRFGSWTFLFEVRSNLLLSKVSLLKPAAGRAHPPVVLVVPYVTPATAQVLQSRNLLYLDTVGNAFLKSAAPDLLVLVQGQRASTLERPETGRAFRRVGLRLLYHLLNEPALMDASYRVLADKASLSLGSVSAVLADLRRLGLLREAGDKRRWLDAPHVLRRWVEGYGEVLRLKLGQQRYRWLEAEMGRAGWQQLLPLGINLFWGGEPAAHLLLEGHLLPEIFTLYSTATRGELMRRFQLVPDPAGPVEVLTPFETTAAQYRAESKAVSPLLAYADLLLTADPRNREVAQLLHERYLFYLT